MKRVGYLVAGYKGWALLSQTFDLCEPKFIASLTNRGQLCGSFKKIETLSKEKQIPLLTKKEFDQKDLNGIDLLFVAGWPFLTEGSLDKYVMFHDSLLPKFRGFAPTISALIEGENQIGISAFQPTEGMDEGPLYGQEAISIQPPLSIKSAYEKLTPCYRNLAQKVLETPSLTEQPKEGASYCLWRDELDYFIDWDLDTDRILRTILALGWPYDGARTSYRRETIIIHRATALPRIDFVNPQPGRIWKIEGGRPIVTTGDGLIRLEEFSYLDGRAAEFTKLRERLGKTPPTKEIS